MPKSFVAKVQTQVRQLNSEQPDKKIYLPVFPLERRRLSLIKKIERGEKNYREEFILASMKKDGPLGLKSLIKSSKNNACLYLRGVEVTGNYLILKIIELNGGNLLNRIKTPLPK